jgi:hypothetical protein
MILVAGLAAAGLVGIAAAFYFSMRTGNGGYRSSSRRFSGAGRSRAEGRRNAAADDWAANDHRAADNSRSVNTKRGANAGRPANAGRAGSHASGNYRGEAHTGPNTAVDFGGLVSGPPAGRPGEAPGDPRSADAAPPVTPTPLAAFGLAAADPGAAAEGAMGAGPAKEPKSRRRMGWRKGTDIDEEMWPTEAFGGLSDDQFWDDLASDKPLTTTARTAHQDSGARNRPPVPADRADGHSRRTAPEAGNAPRYPRSRGSVPPAQAVQPAQAIQPVQAPPVPQVLPQATQPVPSLRGEQPEPGRQPMRTATGPNQTRAQGRRHAEADEDPLTSTAFSLRASGPVDGRSNQVPSGPQEASWDQYNAAVSQETETQTFRTADAHRPTASWSREGSADPYSGTSAYLYPGRPSGDRRPYGESRPYQGNQARSEPATGPVAVPPANGTPAGDPYGSAPAGEPSRQNGAGTRRGQAPRPGPGYQGPALPGEGHRRPRDPRDGYRRLATERS